MTKRDMAKLDLGALSRDRTSSTVTLTASVGGADVQWDAVLVRSEGVVDQLNRAQYLVAQLDDPYNIRQSRKKPALLMGTFVRAAIAGKKLDKIFAIPRHALLEGDNIAAVTRNRLRLKKGERPAMAQFYYITNGLEEGVEIIVSAVGIAIDGMRVSL